MRETRSGFNFVCMLVALLLLMPLFSVNVTAATPPDYPPTITADRGNAKITLNWTAPVNNGGSSIDGYLVYKGTSPQSMTFYRNVGPTPPLTFIDQTVINGQTYYYNITAHNSQGEGAHSATVSAMPLNVPSAPTSATATPATGQMSLSWSPPYNDGGSNISGYRIYRGTSPSFLLFLNFSTQTSYRDVGLSNGQTYYYRISAVNALGQGPNCSISGILASTPGPLQDIQAVPSDSKVNLTWTAPTDNGGSLITGYNIYRSIHSGQETALVTVIGTSYQDTNLVNGVMYYYQLRAVNVMGPGRISDEVSSVPAAVLGPPTSITIVPSNSTLTLSWTAPANNGGSPASSYKVYRGTSATTLLFLVSVNQTSYLDSGLTNGQTYYYKISSVNSVGEGVLFAQASATPLSVPSPPSSLSAVGANGQVSLGWAAPFSTGGASISRYHVYWSESATGPWTMIDTHSVGLVYVHSGLVNGHTYYYSVAAVNSVGEGARSGQTSAVPAAAPGAPTQFMASPNLRNITLSWAAPSSNGGSAIIGYHILRGSAPGSESQLADVGSGPYIDSPLNDGVTYYYKVVAYSAMGDGPASVEAAATTFSLPGAPSSLHAAVSDHTVSLRWSAPDTNGGTPVIYYIVYGGDSDSSMSIVTTTSSLFCNDTGLNNGHLYHYAVTAKNAVGEGPATVPITAMPCTTPSTPLQMTAAGGIRQVVLSWSPPSDNGGAGISSYRLYRSIASNGPYELVLSFGSTSYTDAPLDNGVHYFYRVAAVNAVGEGPYSGSNATTATLPIAPTLSADREGLEVHLSWTTSPGASTYRVYRGTGSGLESSLVSVGANAYVDGPFSAGGTYFYYVTGANATGESAPSNEVVAAIVTVPSAPTNLITSLSATRTLLNWNAPTNEGGSALRSYQVLRGLTHGTETLIGTCDTTSFNDTDMIPGQRYFYQVKATNLAGTSLPSNEASIVYIDTLTAPHLTATAGPGRVTLQWSQPGQTNGGASSGYNVYRGTASGSETLLIGVHVTEMTDTGVTVGRTYYYRVCEVNSAGEGILSNEAIGKPFTYPGTPPAFNATGSVGSALLNWSVPLNDGFSPIVGYHVLRGTDPHNLSQVAEVTETEYRDTDVAGGTYYYSVTAFNSAGDGNATSEVAVSIPGKGDPPIGLTAISSDGKIILTWNPPTGAHVFTYTIFRGNESGGETSLINDPSTRWVDYNVTAGKTYYYKISATTSKGESQMSEEAQATALSVQNQTAQNGALLDQMWFRIVIIMTILVAGFFSFVLFVRKGKVQVKRDR